MLILLVFLLLNVLAMLHSPSADYSLSIPLPSHIKEKIATEQLYLFTTANIQGINPAGIAIAVFSQTYALEQKMITRLKNHLLPVAPFRLCYRNYEAIPSHTIMFVTTELANWKSLQKQLSSHASDIFITAPGKKPVLFQKPDIMLANKIDSKKFSAAWPVFSQRQISFSFIADKIFLLKKQGTHKTCIHQFSLQPNQQPQQNLLF